MTDGEKTGVDRSMEHGMGAKAALRLEFGVIGLGILALLMIFQPFSITLFSIGCGLVVLAALANNLLPLAAASTPFRSIALASAIIALIFVTALLAAITAAHLYGLAFLNPPEVSLNRRPSTPFWEHAFVQGLAVLDLVLIGVVVFLSRRR